MTEYDYVCLLILSCIIIGVLLLVIKEYHYRCRILERHIRYLNELMLQRYEEDRDRYKESVKQPVIQPNDESKEGSD